MPDPSSPDAREWLERAPFHRLLGLEVSRLAEGGLTLRMPFDRRLTTQGTVLHGGVAPALVSIAGRALAQLSLPGSAPPPPSVSLSTTYLVPAIEQNLVIEASLLQARKTFCFTRVDICSESGDLIALGTATFARREPGGPEARLDLEDLDRSAPPAVPDRLAGVPMFGHLGLGFENAAGSGVRVRLPHRGDLADLDGALHESAMLALMDVAGATSSHAAAGRAGGHGATVSLEIQVTRLPEASADLVALGQCRARHGTLYWGDISVASATTGELTARGSITYRIVPRTGRPESPAGG